MQICRVDGSDSELPSYFPLYLDECSLSWMLIRSNEENLADIDRYCCVQDEGVAILGTPANFSISFFCEPNFFFLCVELFECFQLHQVGASSSIASSVACKKGR